MAVREGRAPLARRVAIYGAAGLAAIAVAALWSGAASQRRADAAYASAAEQAPGGASASAVVAHAAVPASTGLPSSLAGASAPRLPLDAGGHLAKSRAVRDFFDYCLTAQSDLNATALDALVVREIAAQLDGTIAQREALDVWHRYRAYLDALATLPQAGAVDKSDPGALQLALDQRASIGYRTLGDWSQPFFGAEQWRQRYDLARLKIAQDRTLTDAQKAERLAALAQQMPDDERAAQQKVDRQRAAIDQIAQLQKSGATPDAMRAQLTQTLGPEAAARVAQMQQDDASWQSRYADYAAQRAQIVAAGLSAQDRDARIAALRQRIFTKPGEAVRAASLDRGAAAAQ
ncbi:lipase secretion chaperone [Burkholderia sp. AU19243]|uniref:lipase secretion chaperone n=1 Tax=Burkholderia TaxID=32008 RepID=UPI001AE42611|nr:MULTISPECIES: lipase secretion chaperone [Burkholderia]MBR8145556.1 lipase secretion chaperone [Burkholderia vietnamiensis]MBR8365402.1 lipase secretion chaperone [Burkholderia sp. AU19243]MBY4695380.1 lipase secretion chaperone [Burkholderia latens]QTO46026.1 lipase secretion chaperone [Burkholderia latens]